MKNLKIKFMNWCINKYVSIILAWDVYRYKPQKASKPF